MNKRQKVIQAAKARGVPMKLSLSSHAKRWLAALRKSGELDAIGLPGLYRRGQPTKKGLRTLNELKSAGLIRLGAAIGPRGRRVHLTNSGRQAVERLGVKTGGGEPVKGAPESRKVALIIRHLEMLANGIERRKISLRSNPDVVRKLDAFGNALGSQMYRRRVYNKNLDKAASKLYRARDHFVHGEMGKSASQIRAAIQLAKAGMSELKQSGKSVKRKERL